MLARLPEMLHALLRPGGRVTAREAGGAVVLLAVCLTAWLLAPISGEAGWRAPDLPGAALMALMVLPVAARRVLPVPAMLLAGLAALVTVAGGYGFTLGQLVVWGLLGSTALHTDRRTTLALAVVGGVSVAGSVAVFSADDRQALGLVVAAGVGTLPCLVGDALRRQRELTEEVRRLREAEVQQALDAERLRIARDVHDSVGHHLSAISLQAQAGQLAGGGQEALATIGQLSRRAIEDTGRILGLLRGEEDAPAPPVPRLDDLDELTRTAALADVDVRRGRIDPTDDLPDLVSTCGYRIVQEALTNVARHAAPARAELRIARADGVLSITVLDDGAATAAGPPGRGLAGMRERVHAVGGSVDIAPVSGGGWRVHAELPEHACTPS